MFRTSAIVRDNKISEITVFDGAGRSYSKVGIFRSPEPFVFPEGDSFPAAAWNAWSDEEKLARGIVPLEEPTEQPDDDLYRIVESVFSVQEDKVVESYTIVDRSSIELGTRLDSYIAARQAEVGASLGNRLEQGLPWAGNVVQIRPSPKEDLLFITAEGAAAKFAMQEDESYTISFRMKDNQAVVLTAQDMSDLSDAARARVKALRAAAWSKTAAMAAVKPKALMSPEMFLAAKAALEAIDAEVQA